MNFILAGTNHRLSPVEIREKLSLTTKGIKDALALLCELKGVKGVVILSTCNRIEFYINGDIGLERIKEFIYRYYERRYPELEPYLYTHRDIDAMRHLFNVAGGLDSQILGETQILGQVKDAYQTAKDLQMTDPVIDKIFVEVIRVGGKIRQETGIAEGNVSIGSVAIDIIKKKIGGLNNKKILIIGVGKVSNLVIKYLYKENVNTVFVSNRTYEKAVEFAREINGEAVRFDRLREHIRNSDVIISTTKCPHVILEKEDFREYREPLLILDLAVPRDVSPDVKELNGVELLCLDDLEEIIVEAINKKKTAIPFAEAIINDELDRLASEVFSKCFY